MSCCPSSNALLFLIRDQKIFLFEHEAMATGVVECESMKNKVS